MKPQNNLTRRKLNSFKPSLDGNDQALISVSFLYWNRLTPVPNSLGLTLLEGMSCETPTICGDAGGMPETTIDGETGFVIEGSDVDQITQKILWIKEHPVESSKMGTRARARARERVNEKFTWSKVSERCLEVYNNYS